ncbi:MAG: TetR/AcrR family transcriptional regulator [Candidatus Sericytochromatia bacterium]|nr:TetR/AcrR family transcriptional regulator [Candidatus Tanganyikabacteria bacterium]
MAIDARPRGQRRDARENCEKVLRAARTVFVRDGFDASMEEIARVAGVGVGTIYRRYPGKEILLGELVQETCELHLSLLEATLARPEHPPALLREVVHLHFRMGEEHAMLLDMLAPESPDADVTDSPRAQAYLRERALLEGLIRAGMDQGVFAKGDPLPMAAMIMELLHWQSCERMRRSLGLSSEAAADQLTKLVLGGLGVSV